LEVVVKRFLFPAVVFLSWVFLIGASTGFQINGQEGWPPQTALFNDAALLSRSIPFIIALGILAGIYQARQAAKNGGDAILGERVRRHDTSVMMAHWMNAVGLILGLVSGGVILRWVERPEELRSIFVIHYLGAALTLFAIFNHLTRHGVSGGTGLIPKSFGVIRDLIGELLAYLGLFGPDEAVLKIPWPKAIRIPIARYAKALLGYKESETGKYLSTEQLISYPPWVILITLIVFTGLIKSLRYTWNISDELLVWATGIHDIVAIAIGVMLVIHLLPLLLVPANWPLLLSMFKSTVPVEYVKKRHPKWYRDLKLKQPEAVLDIKSPASEEESLTSEALATE
jgi:cytochrome b subunit of formate dehydrogenase